MKINTVHHIHFNINFQYLHGFGNKITKLFQNCLFYAWIIYYYVCLLIRTCLTFKIPILFQFICNTITSTIYATHAKLTEDTITAYTLSASSSRKLAFFRDLCSILTAKTPSTLFSILCSLISWLVLTILSEILNILHYWSSLYITFPNAFRSGLHLPWYFSLLVFPCFHSEHSLHFSITLLLTSSFFHPP